MSIPKISLIVPAYNVETHIKAALLSLENQTFKNFEALVVDDGSTDKTPQIVESFCARDSRFSLLQKANEGLSSARNYGIRHSHGEYVSLLNGDDIYDSEKLANHHDWMMSSAQIGVIYSASQAIHDDGTLTIECLSGKPIKSDPLAALFCRNFIGHGSNAMFRRCIFDEVGEFDETLDSYEDVDYWLRIAANKKWRFHREKKVLCFYRVRSSRHSSDIWEMKSSQLRVIIAACKRNPELIDHLLPTAYAYLHSHLAQLCLVSNDINSARRYLERALNSDETIFLEDSQSLSTLISVRLASLSELAIRPRLFKPLNSYKSLLNQQINSDCLPFFLEKYRSRQIE